MKKNIVKLILGLTAILAVFGAMNIFGVFSATGSVVWDTAEVFNIKAFRFGYAPNEIIVNEGDKVRIIIENADVLHGIRIPELDIAGNTLIEFTADKTGEFTWYCNTFCGTGHGSMNGKLIVKKR